MTIVEEGPWVDPDALEPFSLQEMVAKYRHGGSSAALGRPAIAYAEGRCVGGSTEINSGLYHRLPVELAQEWRETYRIDEFTPDALERYADRIEDELSVSRLPGAPPPSSAILERGAVKLGWRAVEFARVFRYEHGGRAVKQTMARTFLPRAIEGRGARRARLPRRPAASPTATGWPAPAASARARTGRPKPLTIRSDHVFVCAGAIQTPALLQRSGVRRNVGRGLKMHATVKIAARFPHPIDHGDVPMHRVTEFAPSLTIGGSASRRGHVAMALADSAADYRDALAHWEHVAVYYAAMPQRGVGPRRRPPPAARAARDLPTSPRPT
ncbi:MAG: hypothetical protein KatS3mg010_1895 [Acidimicrobiia bacterium]|nr:MAG: hypothetical protein KatS3mg010_1895 [Acidimicrobiia bacterium]